MCRSCKHALILISFDLFQGIYPYVITSKSDDKQRDLWENPVFSDLSLKVDGQVFRVHKLLLAIASDFFMAMLTSHMRESTSNEIELKGVTAKGLEPVLKHIYTNQLEVTGDNICEVLLVASHLQMEKLLFLIRPTVESLLNPENCMELLNITTMRCLTGLKCSVDKYISDNFSDVLAHRSHLQMDLKNLPDMQIRCFGPEKRVFSLLVDWIKYNEDERMKDIDRVMEVVRFPLLTLEEIEDCLLEFPALTENAKCRSYIEKARHYLSSPEHQKVALHSQNTEIRNYHSILALSAQPSTRKIQAHFLCVQDGFDSMRQYRPRKAKWVQLVEIGDDMPNITLNPQSVSSLVVNDFLILVGVHDRSEDKKNPPKGCYMFDPRCLKWTKLSDMVLGRHSATLAFYRKHLYAFGGGASIDTPTNLDSIECYNFNENKWTEVGTMPLKLRNHAVCVFNDELFICGGKGEDSETSKALFKLVPESNKFQMLCNMPSPWGESYQMYNMNGRLCIVQPETGWIKTYNPSDMSWKNFWGYDGERKIPKDGQTVEVNGDVLFINGLLGEDTTGPEYEERNTPRHFQIPLPCGPEYENAEVVRFPQTDRACVHVNVSWESHGVFTLISLHDDYPSGLDKPMVLAGLRLPSTLTKSAQNSDSEVCKVSSVEVCY